ncbi:MAG: dephospho-CoA kinase [Syntrophobacterales bacterium]|nr:dephospho-CoA kinase [Syntrophobacterales bacterium]
MLKIALTGGAGTGKSTVARMFADLGAVVLSADEIAREVVRPHTPVWEALRREFGPDFFHEDGTLNRVKLGRLVFAEPEALGRLNAIVHPAITRELERRLRELALQGTPLVIVEVPLLFETGREGEYDAVIVVDAPLPEQRARLKARDDRGEEEISGLLAAQMPLAEKRRRADYVVDNSGTLDRTRRQVENLWHLLQNRLDKARETG